MSAEKQKKKSKELSVEEQIREMLNAPKNPKPLTLVQSADATTKDIKTSAVNFYQMVSMQIRGWYDTLEFERSSYYNRLKDAIRNLIRRDRKRLLEQITYDNIMRYMPDRADEFTVSLVVARCRKIVRNLDESRKI